MKINRRKMLKTLGILGGAGLLAGLYAWQIEPFWLEFVTQDMPIKALPDSLKGKTLMQISDIHVGNRFDRQYLINSLQKAQIYQPEIVVYTGDFVSYESEEQLEQLAQVMQHAPKGSLGTFAILGNHDYGKNWREPKVADAITDYLKSIGIVVLRNEITQIAGLNIIGLDDFWGTNYAPEPVLAQIDPSQANLVLCHNPDVADQDVWHGYQGWILSGHTHGGQCKPPFLRPPMLPVKNKAYSAGKIALQDGRTLYINRALGHLWQVRFNVRPEITIFKLMA
jgi:uncharacterized protein